MPTEYEWSPLSVDEVSRLLEPMRRPWWVAGGWAIDLFLGRQTRPHADLDIAMLRGDELALPQALGGWDIRIAHDGELIPWNDAPLAREHHQFWLRSTPDGPWQFEVLFEEHDGEIWRYRRDHAVTRALSRFGRRTVDGVPCVAPEIALLYKAKGHDIERNAADFVSAHAALDADAREWLRDALNIAHPGHPWLREL